MFIATPRHFGERGAKQPRWQEPEKRGGQAVAAGACDSVSTSSAIRVIERKFVGVMSLSVETEFDLKIPEGASNVLVRRRVCDW